MLENNNLSRNKSNENFTQAEEVYDFNNDGLIGKYLNSVEYAFDKGKVTTDKVSEYFNKIPELNSKRLFQITFVLLLFSLVIFLASCQTRNNNQYGNRVNSVPLPNMQPKPMLSNGIMNKGDFNKGQEQLYIKREQKSIKQRESGSSTGSIWADSSSPKSLVTEFKPSKPGDVVTVNIPENLQFKPDANTQAGSTAQNQNAQNQKVEPVKSFKFEVVGIEPGGDVYLRGVKNYTSDNGEQRNVVVMAKVPRRNINDSEINAKDLTEVAVNENVNGMQSDYASTGWDPVVSRKISGYAPDATAQLATLNAEKKDIETQKKSLAEQKKSLDAESERIKKDRKRLDTETARAKSIIDAATIVGSGSDAGNANPPAGQGNKPATSAPAANGNNAGATAGNNAGAQKP